MSERGDLEYIKDILEAIHRIKDFTRGMNQEEVLEDLKTRDAVLRNLEIIGEAVKNISSETKAEHPDIEWKKIGGMRDKIIHMYFGVNWDILWDVIEEKLPELEKDVKTCLKELGEEK